MSPRTSFLSGVLLAALTACGHRSDVPDLPRAALHQKADEIDRQIHDLTALRDTLRHVADCRAPSHMECPTFRRLVDVAGKRSRKHRNAGKPDAKTGPRAESR